jgi:hypothetical protein
MRVTGYFEPSEARTLITDPEPGFPPIYPEGAVVQILGATYCHASPTELHLPQEVEAS